MHIIHILGIAYSSIERSRCRSSDQALSAMLKCVQYLCDSVFISLSESGAACVGRACCHNVQLVSTAYIQQAHVCQSAMCRLGGVL